MKASKLAFGAVIGAAVGIVAGVLTAPKSGKETREDLLRKAESAKDKAASTRDDLVFKLEEAIDEVKTKAVEAIESATGPKDK